jgi:hypothetical protein
MHLLQLRQDAWVKAINGIVDEETKLNLIKFQYICGRHFVSGQPAKLEDADNVDWLPTLHMNNKSIVQNTNNAVRIRNHSNCTQE